MFRSFRVRIRSCPSVLSSQLENCQVTADIKPVRPDHLGTPNLVEGSPRLTHSSNANPQANILITSDNPVRACLADFGFMTIVHDDADGPESTSALGGGATPFMVPDQAPSCESVFDSGTQRYGKGSRLRLVCWCAHSSVANIFVTANAEPQTEGMLDATSWTTGLNPSPIRVSTVPHARKS